MLVKYHALECLQDTIKIDNGFVIFQSLLPLVVPCDIQIPLALRNAQLICEVYHLCIISYITNIQVCIACTTCMDTSVPPHRAVLPPTSSPARQDKFQNLIL